MATFKEEMRDLAVELIELDEDFKTVSVQLIHRRPEFQTYDEISGDIYSFDSEASVTAVVGPFVDTQQNAQDVQIGDLQMIMAVKTASFVPEPQNDFAVFSDGTVYNMLSVTKDAAEAVYIVQLRASADEDA